MRNVWIRVMKTAALNWVRLSVVVKKFALTNNASWRRISENFSVSPMTILHKL